MGLTLAYGATGTQGGPVARRLVLDGERVRLLVRDAEKVRDLEAMGAEIAVGDLGDLDSLRRAHEGVDKVFLHLPLQYDFALHRAYGRNAVAAAVEAGVELVVVNTTAHVFDDSGVEIYDVRKEVLDELRAAALPAIVLRPTFYMDNWLGPWILPGIAGAGVLAFALPNDHPMSWVSADEVGAYAAAALARPDLAGATYDIGGPEALTGDEIAATLTAALGKAVRWVSITPDAYEEALLPLLGPAVATAVADQVRYIVRGGHGPVDMRSTSALFGVRPLPLREWAPRQRWDIAPVAAV